ncbi:MAG: iron ABC transporter permease [Fluviicola sp.]|nr:iron ABC transporter permease [Fluviicola sp.]
MVKWQLSLGILLLALAVLAIGLPHANGAWFAFWNASDVQQANEWILLTVYRIPEVFIAVLAGMALAVSGLLLQTVLNNPLAGPSILGLTSGSHLFVALVLMGGSFSSDLFQDVSTTFAAAFGAFVFGMLILLIATKMRSAVSLLLVGMMLGTFVSAFTGLLMSHADSMSLKSFTMWSFGSLRQVALDQIPLIASVFMVVFIAAFFLVKPLNAMVLGEHQAAFLGVNIVRNRWIVILIVSLLTGLVTAFCGPIAFIGLIVPNIVKMTLKTANHLHLMIASALIGGIVLLICSMLIRLLEPLIVLPINTLTSLIGAPVVLLLLLKKIRNA